MTVEVSYNDGRFERYSDVKKIEFHDETYWTEFAMDFEDRNKMFVTQREFNDIEEIRINGFVYHHFAK